MYAKHFISGSTTHEVRNKFRLMFSKKIHFISHFTFSRQLLTMPAAADRQKCLKMRRQVQEIKFCAFLIEKNEHFNDLY